MTTATVTTAHRLQVPLDHSRGDGEMIEVLAREVAAADGRDRPYLLFLQGGPGQEAAQRRPGRRRRAADPVPCGRVRDAECLREHLGVRW